MATAPAPKFYEGQEFHNPDDPSAPVLIYRGGKFLQKTPTITQQQFDDASAQVHDLDQVAQQAKNLHGGLISSMFAKVPGSDAYDVNKNLETIRARITFDNLKDMKAQSQTGASGLGAVSDREGALLAATLGNVDLGQDHGQLTQNLQRVKDHYVQRVPGVTEQSPLDLSSGETRANLPIGIFYRDPQGNIRRNDNGDKGNPIITQAQKRQQLNDMLKSKSGGAGGFLGWEN